MPRKSLITFVALSALWAAGQKDHPSSSDAYKVTVIDGEGALNNLATTEARDPVIQLLDAKHRPVAGAYVEFDTPGNGPGAHFLNDSTHYAITTNGDGLAVASGMSNNGLPGAYSIQVHVSFRGQGIGEIRIHQTNVAAVPASHLHQTGATSASSALPLDVKLSSNVLGIALGEQFLVDGASTPSNANLLDNTRVHSLSKPATLYLHSCEFQLASNSSITVGPKLITIDNGSVRARRFGDCRIAYGRFLVTGSANTEAAASISGSSLEIISMRGVAQILANTGEVVGSVSAGTVAAF